MGIVDHEGQAAVAVGAVEIEHPLKTGFHGNQDVGCGAESHLEHVADVKPQIDRPVGDVEQVVAGTDDVVEPAGEHPHINQIEQVEPVKGEVLAQNVA